MSRYYPTQFVEANALLAIIREETHEARDVLEDSTPNELRSLGKACDALAFLCEVMWAEKGGDAP